MRYLLRTLISIVAAVCVVFSGVALAQDEGELPTTQAECEAAGYIWGPEDIFDFGDQARCGGPEWGGPIPIEAAVGEQTPPESAASADLPATEPAAAQQGSPQYTG